MNEREIERLRARLIAAPRPNARRAVVRIVICFVAAGVLWGGILLIAPILDASIGSAIIFCMAAFGVIAVELDRGSSRRRIERTVSEAIAAGVVEVERVESTAVVEFAEQSDEGPNYFFEVEPNQIYSFCGQDAYEIGGEPNSCFEIVRVLEPRTELGVFNCGEAFIGHHVVTDFTYDDLPTESGLVEGSIESLIRAAGRTQSA